MKITRLVFPLLLMTLFGISCSKEEALNEPFYQVEESQYLKYTIGEGPFVQFDDVVFKELLLNNFEININKDNEISFEEAKIFNGEMDVSFKNIESLTGIDKFINLIALNCANNNLASLDLRTNVNLEFLSCGGNPFTEIDLSRNTKIKNLDIRSTHISNLDLSKNENLMSIRGMCNSELKTVNVRNNNNTKILVFFFWLNNFSLECVQVDDIEFSNSASNWFIPEGAAFSLNCFDE